MVSVVMLAPGTLMMAQSDPKKFSPAGTWEIRGNDQTETKWIGKLVLTSGSDGKLADTPPLGRLNFL
ncbi:MAG: hypothetical protein IAG10_11740 [Planctomycetaceae bacterium]|nr:hypothetical protein [Planctomycetaceae bacterium]